MSLHGKDAYFKKYNLRFVYAPKTGWTSLRNADVGFVWEYANKLPKDCINFSVYRDPFERFKSGYKEVIGKPIRKDPDLVKGIDVKKYTQIQKKIRMHPFGSHFSIAAYIDSIKEFGIWDGHQISYVDSLKDPERGREKLDLEKIVFLDFKNLKSEFDSLINENIHIPHMQIGSFVNHSIFLEFKSQINELIHDDKEFFKINFLSD